MATNCVCDSNEHGVKGNENIFEGVVLCDYCTVRLRPVLDKLKELNDLAEKFRKATEQRSRVLDYLRQFDCIENFEDFGEVGRFIEAMEAEIEREGT